MLDTSIIIALIGSAASIVGFLVGRRKRRAETIGSELNNMQMTIQAWKDIAEYQTKEICAMRKEIDELKKEISSVERLHNERFSAQCQTCIYRINK